MTNFYTKMIQKLKNYIFSFSLFKILYRTFNFKSYSENDNLKNVALSKSAESIIATRSLFNQENIILYLDFKIIIEIILNNYNKFNIHEINFLLSKNDLNVLKLASYSSALAIMILNSELINSLTATELAKLCFKYQDNKNFQYLMITSEILPQIFNKADFDKNKNILKEVKQIFSKSKTITALLESFLMFDDNNESYDFPKRNYYAEYYKKSQFSNFSKSSYSNSQNNTKTSADASKQNDSQQYQKTQRSNSSQQNNYQHQSESKSQNISKQKTPFSILGISEISDEKSINKAFKKQSLKLHPDKGGPLEKMQELVEARDQALSIVKQSRKGKERTVSR